MTGRGDAVPARVEPFARPGVGVGLFLLDGFGRFLLMRRKGAHGVASWGLVGGKMEWGASVEETAAAESLQEVGIALDPKDVRQLEAYTSDVFPENVHYVTLFAAARLPPGAVAAIMEPDRCDALQWAHAGSTPRPLFLPLETLLSRGPPRFPL